MSHLAADTIHLANGTSTEGKVLSQDERQVVFSDGATEMVFPRDRVARIDSGVSATYVRRRVQRIVDAAKADLSRNRREQALNSVENAVLIFETESASLDELTPELKALRAELDQLRTSALPQDANSQEAERKYQAALRKIDFVDYEGAFRDLREAATLAPTRADIAWRLAGVAVQLRDNQVAIDAYRAAVRENADAYYQQAARPLLTLLKTQGQRYLAERRGSEAVDVFREILLLEGAAPGTPADLAEYSARVALRESKPEEEVLMEVYRYADGNDLVDLAFAAITRVAEKKPGDPEVAKLLNRSRLYATLKDRIDAKDTEGAAALLAAADEDLEQDAEARDRIRRIAGDLDADVQARRMLADAKELLDKARFAEAAAAARAVIARYPSSKPAEEAVAIIAAADLEAPAAELLTKARRQIAAQKFEEAEITLDEALALPRIAESRYQSEIRSLRGRMPDEREAERIFRVAEIHLERGEHAEAQARLEQLASSYSSTVAGAKAIAWLAEHRRRLEGEVRTTKLVDEYSFFSFADPNLWRAAADPTRPSPGRLPPVPSERRDAIWNQFKAMGALDLEATRDRRSPLLYIAVPVCIVAILLLVMVWQNARPGKGRLVDPESSAPISGDGPPLASGEFRLPTFGAEPTAISCKMCGLPMPEEALACGKCGSTRQLSALERERAEAMEKQADFDPWDMRVKAKAANEFEPHFRKAQDLAQTSDVQAAVEACRMALHEDPQRKEGYLLLAELYERMGNAAEAATCYREVLLLDPTEVIVRQKVQKLLQLSSMPLDMKPLVLAVSGLVWWGIFWIVAGIDLHLWPVKLLLALAGWGLTSLLWLRAQGSQRMTLPGKEHPELDVHRPLPTELLTWREQRRQARHIVQAIADHIGVEVPLLTPWRIVWTAVVSLAFFLALVALAWTTHAPWALLAWPGGTAVFYYLLVLQPRLFVANVILRHIYEETSSPWVDPHRPFKPMNGPYAGEFLLRDTREAPLRWAFNPFPYGGGSQAVLNSIQQTLNRHWSCHRFYEKLHPVQDANIPYPGGRRLVWPFGLLSLSAAVVVAAWMLQADFGRPMRYDDAMMVGYQTLMQGETGLARDEFLRAMQLYPQRAMPHLYMAHLSSGMGHRFAAERAFRRAEQLGPTIPAINNDFGNFLQRNGRLRDAIGQYEKALRRDGQNADVLNNLGSAHYKLGEHTRAVEYLERATAADANHGRAWTTLGLALEELGMSDRAIEAYDTAIRVAPDLPYTGVARDRREQGAKGRGGAFDLTPDMPAN